jgi:hypothetical protein
MIDNLKHGIEHQDEWRSTDESQDRPEVDERTAAWPALLRRDD